MGEEKEEADTSGAFGRLIARLAGDADPMPGAQPRNSRANEPAQTSCGRRAVGAHRIGFTTRRASGRLSTYSIAAPVKPDAIMSRTDYQTRPETALRKSAYTPSFDLAVWSRRERSEIGRCGNITSPVSAGVSSSGSTVTTGSPPHQTTPGKERGRRSRRAPRNDVQGVAISQHATRSKVSRVRRHRFETTKGTFIAAPPRSVNPRTQAAPPSKIREKKPMIIDMGLFQNRPSSGCSFNVLHSAIRPCCVPSEPLMRRIAGRNLSGQLPELACPARSCRIYSSRSRNTPAHPRCNRQLARNRNRSRMQSVLTGEEIGRNSQTCKIGHTPTLTEGRHARPSPCAAPGAGTFSGSG